MYAKENILTNNTKLKVYIIVKGMEMINNIFNIMLFYTKNLDFTIYHIKKSYCYYIEFIEQIDNDNSILKLTVKDAILFVYKKTIFDIDDIVKKPLINTINDTKILIELSEYTHLYNNMIIKGIKKQPDIFYDINDTHLEKILKNNTHLINRFFNTDDDLRMMKLCDYLLDKINITNHISINKTYLLLELFIKKIKTEKKENYKHIENNIYNISLINNTLSHVKIVNELLLFQTNS